MSRFSSGASMPGRGRPGPIPAGRRARRALARGAPSRLREPGRPCSGRSGIAKESRCSKSQDRRGTADPRIRSPAFLNPYLEPCAKMIQPSNFRHPRGFTEINMAGSILIVDDDPVQRRLLEGAVSRIRPRGHRRRWRRGGAEGRSTGPRGRDIARRHPRPGRCPASTASACSRRCASASIAIPVIVQTAQGGIETVVSAMRAGAFDFVVKPASPERLHDGDRQRAEGRGGRSDASAVAPAGAARSPSATSSPRSPAMERVDPARRRRLPASNIPILIEGEFGRRQGTDRARHPGLAATAARSRSSPSIAARSPTTWSRASCSATKRAPSPAPPRSTPASSSRRMPARCSSTRSATCRATCRSSCLRAVQDGEVDPVGARATGQGRHQADLGHPPRSAAAGQGRPVPRGSVLSPQRLSDLRAAAARPARGHSRTGRALHGAGSGRAEAALSGSARSRGDALAMLSAYDWPGNIRQLENAVFRAMVLCEGDMLTVDDFPQIRAQVEGIALVGYPVPRPAAPAIAAASAAARRGAARRQPRPGRCRPSSACSGLWTSAAMCAR